MRGRMYPERMAKEHVGMTFSGVKRTGLPMNVMGRAGRERRIPEETDA